MDYPWNGISCKHVIISEGIWEIPCGAIRFPEAESVRLPESLVNINAGAFDGMRSLKRLCFGKYVMNIEDGFFDDLLAELERQGFTVKRDKNVLIKAPGQQRSVSLWKLGEDYTKVSIQARINMLQTFTSPAEKQLDVYRLSEMLAVINKDHISSIGDLEGRILRLKKEYEKSKGEKCREKLRAYLYIRDTYNEISKGDYISKLVYDERQRKETQKARKKPNKRR